MSKNVKISNTLASKVSQAELDALGGTMRSQFYGGADRFFRWRNLFMASVALFMLIRLLFFAYDDLPAAYPPPGGSLDVKHYLQIRALGVGLVIVLYSFSYLRDWFFPQVALFFFAVAVANLTMDIFNFYVLFEDGMTKVDPGFKTAV
jgi:hypothetical protein